jgi:glutamate formiminotransferase/formiminotetrahydrofolate cyclodeaminase
MELALDSMEVLEAMATLGNPNSISDAGVGAMASRSAVLGAGLNVRINAKDLDDRNFAEEILGKVERMEVLARTTEDRILSIVNKKLQ